MLAIGYNAGLDNMQLIAVGHQAGPQARSYAENFREAYRRSDEFYCRGSTFRCDGP